MNWKLLAAVAVGTLTGLVAAPHASSTVHASGSGTIYVRNVGNGAAYTDPILANREIIGFSCTAGGPMGSECFIAAR
jgi:hypothetical protein